MNEWHFQTNTSSTQSSVQQLSANCVKKFDLELFWRIFINNLLILDNIILEKKTFNEKRSENGTFHARFCLGKRAISVQFRAAVITILSTRVLLLSARVFYFPLVLCTFRPCKLTRKVIQLLSKLVYQCSRCIATQIRTYLNNIKLIILDIFIVRFPRVFH